jgi:hypothetical protein
MLYIFESGASYPLSGEATRALLRARASKRCDPRRGGYFAFQIATNKPNQITFTARELGIHRRDRELAQRH